jgi:hypothetical protein
MTAGVSAQVGLLVAPVLVFLGMIMGQNMDLIFSPLELIAIVMAIYLAHMLEIGRPGVYGVPIVWRISCDGSKSRWWMRIARKNARFRTGK